MPKRKVRKHKVGSSWKAMRTVGKRRRKVMVTKVGKSRYKVRVLGKKKPAHRRIRHTKRGWAQDRRLDSKQPWEVARRRRKRRRR